MTWLQLIAFSLIEGITEFLPVSSTAHLLLAEKFLPVADKQLFASFTIFIQLGAVLAVLAVFWSSLWHHRKIWPRLIVAVLPTAVIGVVVYKFAKQYLQDASPLTGWMLIIGGVLFSLLDWYWQRARKAPKYPERQLTTSYVGEVEQTSYARLALVGVAQATALVPGVSRSGATMTGAQAVGFSKVSAVALAFIMALPTIAGASLLDLPEAISAINKTQAEDLPVGLGALQEISYNPCGRPPGCGPRSTCPDVCVPTYSCISCWGAALVMISGFLITFVAALVCCRYLLNLLSTKPFWYFGLWRIVVGIVWLGFFI